MKKILSVSAAISFLVYFSFLFNGIYAEGNTAFVSIYEHKNGRFIMQPAEVSIDEGETPLSILKKLNVEYVLSGQYLKSIEGFAELKNGKYSGWVFKINGELLRVSAAAYKLKGGDKLEWIYAVTAEQAGLKTAAQATTAATASLAPQTADTTRYTAAVSSALHTTAADSGTTPAFPSTEKQAVQTGTAALQTKTTAAEPTKTEPADHQAGNNGLNMALAKAAEWLEQHNGNFTPVALYSAGKTIPKPVIQELLMELERITAEDYSPGPTEIERMILNLAAANINPFHAENKNIVDRLVNIKNIGSQGINGYVFALTALDAIACDDSVLPEQFRENALLEILQSQNPDGGFSVSGDFGSDTDMTAMTITALSGYTERQDVQSAVDKALIYLQSQLLQDGAYLSQGGQTGETLSQVIICCSALKANGFNLNIQYDHTLSRLLQYQNPDGGFSHLLSDGSDVMATEQAVLALAAVKYHKNPYRVQHFKTIKKETPFMKYFIIIFSAIVTVAGILGVIAYAVDRARKSKPKIYY